MVLPRLLDRDVVNDRHLQLWIQFMEFPPSCALVPPVPYLRLRSL
ncbi:MAG TPA: hypothetical protein VFG22_02030 [Polyangiales bacterium]|nr:hypothetical protein [Polyangiales bacterium]